jgi:hypothetical protein
MKKWEARDYRERRKIAVGRTLSVAADVRRRTNNSELRIPNSTWSASRQRLRY